jgi:hypothetical protein
LNITEPPATIIFDILITYSTSNFFYYWYWSLSFSLCSATFGIFFYTPNSINWTSNNEPGNFETLAELIWGDCESWNGYVTAIEARRTLFFQLIWIQFDGLIIDPWLFFFCFSKGQLFKCFRLLISREWVFSFVQLFLLESFIIFLLVDDPMILLFSLSIWINTWFSTFRVYLNFTLSLILFPRTEFIFIFTISLLFFFSQIFVTRWDYSSVYETSTLVWIWINGYTAICPHVIS